MMYKFNGELEFKHDKNGKNELVLIFEKECDPVTVSMYGFSIGGDYSKIIISDSVDKNVNFINICNDSDDIQYNIFTLMESFNLENYLKLIELMKHNHTNKEMSIEDWTKVIIDVLIQTVTTMKRNVNPFKIVKMTESDGSGTINTPCKIGLLNTNTNKNNNDVIEILLPFFEYDKFDNKLLSNVLSGKINRQVSPCGVTDNKILLHHHLNLFQIYQLYVHEVRK